MPTILDFGYLITKPRQQGFLEYVCLDEDPEFVPGEGNRTNGVTIHLVEATCNTGLVCPLYHPGKEVACAVCTISKLYNRSYIADHNRTVDLYSG